MSQYLNKVINYEEAIEINDLKKIESEYNFKFPEEIRAFYLQYNGGTLERKKFIKNKKYYILHYFYPIKYTECCLEEILKSCNEQNTPKGLIPFAYDQGGDEFCFSVKEGDEGKIYYVAHEILDVNHPKAKKYLLAKSLNEFINGMI